MTQVESGLLRITELGVNMPIGTGEIPCPFCGCGTLFGSPSIYGERHFAGCKRYDAPKANVEVVYTTIYNPTRKERRCEKHKKGHLDGKAKRNR